MDRLEQKKIEIADKNAAVESYLAKVVSASEERSRAESQLREANGKCSAFESAKARMEQEAALMQQHNEWLRAELQKKSDELLASRKAASAETLKSANALEAAKRDLAAAKRDLAAATERAAASDAAAAKSAETLRSAREGAAEREAHFEKELLTAKRLAELHKTQADARAEKTSELEGVLTELRDHLSEVKEEAKRATEEQRRGKEEAEKALVAEKRNFDDRVAAAVADSVHQNENALPAPQNAIVTPTLAFADGEGVAAASGRVAGALLAARLPDASAAALRRENLTATELYTKYAEAADAWRKECVERRRLQSTVDGMVAELEVRAPMLAEQKAEYDRAVAAHAEMRARLENATVELRRLEAEAKSAAAEKRHAARRAEALEAQSADLSRQVQLLLHETSTLKGGRSGAPPPARPATGDAAAVVTAELVDFRDVAELQEQNRRQLEVIRTLSADQEDLGARLKEKYRAEVEAIQSEAKTALDELESRKAKTQTMVEAIVRQRDMYKALYVSAGAGPGGVADADNAAMTLAEAAAASLAKALPARRRRRRRRARGGAPRRARRGAPRGPRQAQGGIRRERGAPSYTGGRTPRRGGGGEIRGGGGGGSRGIRTDAILGVGGIRRDAPRRRSRVGGEERRGVATRRRARGESS